MRRIYQEIIRQVSAGKAVVLATIVSTKGATPRKPGTKMLIESDGQTIGTIGGGAIEAEVRKLALKMLASDPTPRLAEFSSGDDSTAGPSCGGALEVYLEPILPE